MLPCTEDFATAIKQTGRDINVVIAYQSGDSYIFLQKDNIQSLTYNAKVNKGLGGVVRKVADIKAIYNEYTANLTKGMAINLYYKCGTGNCKKALLYINQVKVNKAKTLSTIEALDYFSYDQTNKALPIMKSVDLITYEKTIFTALGYKYLIDSDVVNTELSLGYPKSGKVLETLEAIAEANNAVIDFEDIIIYGLKLPFNLPTTFSVPVNTEGYIYPGNDIQLHVKKLAFSVPVDVIDEDMELIDFELDDDNSDQYNEVRINLFFPSSSVQKSLGKVTATVPGSVTDYNIGTIDFGNTMIPQLCVFDDMVDFADYSIGSDSFTLSVNNSGVLAQNFEAEMYGLDISEATLKDTNTDSNVKQISNMYVQSAAVYDTKIFKSPNCTMKTFGNPLYEVGDTLQVGDKQVLILEENISFNGGLKANMKGVVKLETN